MALSLFRKISKKFNNAIGWSTKRRIVVLESDDWGSIRMPSLDVAKKLKANGIQIDSGKTSRYNRNDTLANEQDLTALFEVLSKHKDSQNKPAVFTAMSLCANPDFEKIKSDNFSQYHFESFEKTLEKYYGANKIVSTWHQGLNEQLFVPEFHGREHLNVASWMRSLQNGNKETLAAFDQGFWALRFKNKNITFQAAFDLELKEDLDQQFEIIESGLNLFEQIHGYRARYIVPPNGAFNTSLEKQTKEGGIQYICSPKIHQEPLGSGKTKRHFRYLGKKNKYSQRYITRNCFFEPTSKGKLGVDDCLAQIQEAFKWNKPAVISTHRVNYIGGLQEDNRKLGLKELDTLLTKITSSYPNVEFMTSAELGDTISNVKN